MVHSEEVEMERLREVEVNRLAPGAHFKLANYTRTHTPHAVEFHWSHWTYGTLIYANVSRARVRLEGNQVHVIFGDGETRREFDGNGRSEVNYPPSVEVVPVDEDEWEAQAQESNPRQARKTTRSGGADIMTTTLTLTLAPPQTEVDAKIIRANQARYQFQLKALAKAEAAQDPALIEVAQSRINKIEAAAADLGISVEVLKASEVPAPAPAPKTAAPDKTLKEKNKERVATIRAQKEEKPKREPKEKADKVLDATANCLCGCGLETGGKFRPGHDAKVKSLLYQVERGEIAFTDLPADIQPLVKMAGKKSTAGKDDSDYRVVQSPVKFPGRTDVKLVGRDGKPVA